MLPADDRTTSVPTFNPQNPATYLKPDEPLIGADGRDWSWCYVWFKDVTGLPGYKVGADGSAWTSRLKIRAMGARAGFTSIVTKSHSRLALTSNRGGYQGVGFWDEDGHRVRIKLHTLVLSEFYGPCPPGMLCRHLNGKPWDNRLINLAWGTPAQNNQDSIRHGTMPRGSRHGLSRLQESDIPVIRQLRRRGHKIAEIGRMFGVTDVAVSCICNGKTWAHVPG